MDNTKSKQQYTELLAKTSGIYLTVIGTIDFQYRDDYRPSEEDRHLVMNLNYNIKCRMEETGLDVVSTLYEMLTGFYDKGILVDDDYDIFIHSSYQEVQEAH